MAAAPRPKKKSKPVATKKSAANSGKIILKATAPKVRRSWGGVKPVTRVEKDKKTPPRRRVRELIRKGKVEE